MHGAKMNGSREFRKRQAVAKEKKGAETRRNAAREAQSARRKEARDAAKENLRVAKPLRVAIVALLMVWGALNVWQERVHGDSCAFPTVSLLSFSTLFMLYVLNDATGRRLVPPALIMLSVLILYCGAIAFLDEGVRSHTWLVVVNAVLSFGTLLVAALISSGIVDSELKLSAKSAIDQSPGGTDSGLYNTAWF